MNSHDRLHTVSSNSGPLLKLVSHSQYGSTIDTDSNVFCTTHRTNVASVKLQFTLAFKVQIYIYVENYQSRLEIKNIYI